MKILTHCLSSVQVLRLKRHYKLEVAPHHLIQI